MKPRVGDNILRVSNKMQYLWDMFGDKKEKENFYKIDRLKNAGFRRSVKEFPVRKLFKVKEE